MKEILNIATNLEETGYEFYTQCIKKFNDKHIQDIFTFLAKEELAHKNIFESMSRSKDEYSEIIDDDYFKYLKAIYGDILFANNKNFQNIIDSINTPVKAIVKALRDEKESILYYNELKNIYNNQSESIGLLDKIIKEERKHVILLADILDKINLTLIK